MTITEGFAHDDSKGRRMLKLSWPLLGLLMFLLPAGANAVPLTYNLSGVTFSDNSTASGSFRYDAVTNAYSNVSITTTGGSRFGATYNSVSGGFAPDSGGILLVTMPGTAQTGLPGLALYFSPVLNGAGGSSTLTGEEADCVDPECTMPSGTMRTITAGTVSAGAAATPLTWFLTGFTFQDGGTATGSFVFDASTHSFSSVNITTTNGSTRTGTTYHALSTGVVPDATGALFDTSAAPDQMGLPGLSMFFSSPLTAAGGSSNVNGKEADCADAGCSTPTGTMRLITGGTVMTNPPSFSINDISLFEGDSGTKNFNFTVTLSSTTNVPVKVDFATANDTATLADNDYQAASGTLTFNPGDLTKTITVLVNGDQKFEPDETFFVNLSNPVNATISDNQGLGTILNDDAQGGIISFSQVNYNVNESAGSVTVTFTRGGDVSAAASVDYATDDTGAPVPCGTLNSGLASARCDFEAAFGTLKFAATETQKSFTIPINQDSYTEGPEVFRVNLSNLTGGAVLATPATATVTINDSAAPFANAIDDTTTFVRQQYRDFLNREADMPGLVFWKNNIDKCNDPAQRPAGLTLAQCIDLMRINTSAAFFLSIEFQNSGVLVRSFYVAALNRPATNNMPAFAEFERDTQAVQRGVIVDPNNNAWQTVLANNRTAFMNDFVTRAEFVGLYPTTDTPTQYVDKLYLHAGVSPGTPQERTDAIGEFGSATTASDPGARGRALLRITQNTAFQQREANPAFVQMQYLGYLRRDPNAAPDANFSGYNFWLNKLNSFNGNFVTAEMVKAFITSSEYRQRFGP